MRQHAQQPASSGSFAINSGAPATGGVDASTPALRSVPAGAMSTIHGLGDKFDVNPLTGTARLSIPIPVSAARAGFQPSLGLTYDSGQGNGPFGMGWSLGTPRIYRRTSKGIPTYDDERDTFVYSLADDLVAKLDARGNEVTEADDGRVYSEFIPRKSTEPLRIRKLTNTNDGSVSWQVMTGDNITHVFGTSALSQIRDDSTGAERVFAWLLDASFDANGNAILYTYKPENSTGVGLSAAHEQDRPSHGREANRMISQISYGNTAPNRDLGSWAPFQPTRLPPGTWSFDVVFDYGEFPETLDPSVQAATGQDDGWSCRADPFSSYRSGFEIRTYRTCRRILMFHRFLELGQKDHLVSSTDFGYHASNGITLLSSITTKGYATRPGAEDSFVVASRPALQFQYAECRPELAASGRMNIDRLADLPLQLVDLNGDGVPGLFARCRDAWYFRSNRNAVAATLDEDETSAFRRQDWVAIKELPAHILADGELDDIESSGLVNLARLEGNDGGYYQRPSPDTWGGFRSFSKTLQLEPSGPLLRADLTGDGRDDVFVLQGNLVLWAESLGEEGFSQPELSFLGVEEAEGPSLAAADVTQAIFMADVAGDGLQHLVRIRNSDVSYWPNLGYGRFGRRVIMDNPPVIDPEIFTGRRTCMVDVGGSGCADLVFFPPSGGVDVYLNMAGNQWSDAIHIEGLPPLDPFSSVSPADLFGTGAMCLVWTSSSSSDLFYIDLRNGNFPFHLEKVNNGMGLESRLEYTSSAEFAMRDEEAGDPWIRKLARPLACFARVEATDLLTNCAHIQTFRYRHGYFDPFDREFRGFGMVEGRAWDELATQPGADRTMKTPVAVQKKWFHTGMFLGLEKTVTDYYSREFFAVDHPILQQHVVEPQIVGLDTTSSMEPETMREAVRAMTGLLVRTEEYMDDGTSDSAIPIRVTSNSSTVKMLQGYASPVRPAAFSVRDREVLTVTMERAKDSDYNIAQKIIIEVDDFFNVTRSLEVSYGRLPVHARAASLPNDVSRMQQTALTVFTHRQFTNPVITRTSFRAPAECQKSTYQIAGLVDSGGAVLKPDELALDDSSLAQMQAVPYETDMYSQTPPGQPQLRLFSQCQKLFYDDDGQTVLALGAIGSLGLRSHTLTKAFTQSHLAALYGNRLDNVSSTLRSLGYQQLDGPDKDWWLPSTKQGFVGAEETANPVRDARSRFLLPVFRDDPFGNRTVTEYDSHFLLPTADTNPLGQVTRTSYDYKSLKASLVQDVNGNQTFYTYDPLGDLDGVVRAGKADGEADSLSSFELFPAESDLANFLSSPEVQAPKLLGTATSRTLRDRYAYAVSVASGIPPTPVWEATITRQLPSSSSLAGNYYISIRYFDGRGEVMQQFSVAEPDPTTADQGHPPRIRWYAYPWHVDTFSGNTVKRYKPQITNVPSPDVPPYGAPTTDFYDTLGRPLGSLNPDHSWTKNVLRAWATTVYDRGDVSLVEHPEQDSTLGTQLAEICSEPEYLPSWISTNGNVGAQAAQARAYSNTPTTTHRDPRQQTLVVEQLHASQSLLSKHLCDVEGRIREHADPRGVRVQYDVFDMVGRVVVREMADKGTRHMLHDAVGRLSIAWDSLGSRFTHAYDELGRKTTTFCLPGGTALLSGEIAIELLTYGDHEMDGQKRNIVGQLFEARDQSGVLRYTDRDLLYNPTRTEQQFLSNWQVAPAGGQDVRGERGLDKPLLTTRKFDYQSQTLSIDIAGEAAVEYSLNERGLVNTVTVLPADRTASATALKRCTYDARGKTQRVEYGNGAVASFAWDALTERLSSRSITAGGGAVLESAQYTYDVCGNILSIQESTATPLPVRGADKTSARSFQYDSLERLTQATGRELVRDDAEQMPAYLGSDTLRTVPPKTSDAFLADYSDVMAYDASGNLVSVKHSSAGNKTLPSWMRTLTYDTASNRLLSTRIDGGGGGGGGGGKQPPPATGHFVYDASGNMTNGEALSDLRWDSLNQLRSARSGDGSLLLSFAYDAAGSRTCKPVSNADTGLPIEGRHYYANGLQIRQVFDAATGAPSAAPTSLLAVRLPPDLAPHDPVVLTVEPGGGGGAGAAGPVLRYQMADHQASVRLELDGGGALLSREEFAAYGATTLLQTAAAAAPSASEKLFRYTGREKDDPTGLLHCGRRYYSPRLGRWTAPDPIDTADGLNLYAYVGGNPINHLDPQGTSIWELDKEFLAWVVGVLFWAVILKWRLPIAMNYLNAAGGGGNSPPPPRKRRTL